MAADNFTTNLSLVYTPPGGPVNSGTASLAVAGTYNGGQTGSVDVPIATPIATIFSIPFGSLSSARLCAIRNNMSSDVGVRLNGSLTDNFVVAAGGVFLYSTPVSPGATPLTAVTVVTTATPIAIERVLFWVLGD